MTEFLQFAALIGVFAIAVVAWLFVIYLPGRTMEDWRDKRADRKRKDSKLP
ncbi:MAG: hypothetical protein H0U65_00020 [Rubrobacter sp.]|nr:hypothetical protein [Rubrobacter sp.]